MIKKPLWKFIDRQGSFISDNADRINSLYLPLCNRHPIMSSISPVLRGDLKTGFNSFLIEPISRLGLTNSKISRNFWIYIGAKKIWSAAGICKNTRISESDKFRLEAGLLWQKITRVNKLIGLKSEITSFVPSTNEPVEIMYVEITNISNKTVRFVPFGAIPLYCRSANNLHDHRHVTSLLSRVQKDKFGVIITPTLLFDETGHKENLTSYFVLGTDDHSRCPEHIYSAQQEWTGDDSDLEMPCALFNNLLPDKKFNPQGKEPMAALRFGPRSLKAKEKCSYILLLGITNERTRIKSIFGKFDSPDKVIGSLNTTKTYWQEKSGQNSVNTQDACFDNWLRWVNIQPALRKIFGCSFLPDFDYGRGGRGWRDLWQDCLALILNDPGDVRGLLIDNFSGVRIDGSNATIIGQKPGEFVADRNRISRVWMDHGVWPLITTLLYIHQSSDIDILLEETSYFRDMQLCRAQKKDLTWKSEDDSVLKTKDNRVYNGSLLEHILIQHLTQFFNVGPHNHIRLEGADWNDGLDMAKEFGESVAFTCLYSQNLDTICELLKKLGRDNISLLKEISILLNTLTPRPIDYNDINQKHGILKAYFEAVGSNVSADKISVPTQELIRDLKEKSGWIAENIRKNEWIEQGFFNGYYDNDKHPVEGKINGRIQMTLTGQVFAVLSGIATQEQTKILYQNAKKYLRDKKLKGFRLNTDFKRQQLSLGRAFSFIYGDKENGAFFNHMAVMFAYALYNRGFVKQGYEVINSVYKMSVHTQNSKIYPCLPEYFNAGGRGMYSYLTGSASWFMLTLITRIFGIRGEYGDLIIEPKLVAEQFENSHTLSLYSSFAGRKIEFRFVNLEKKDYGRYCIDRITVNGKPLAQDIGRQSFLIRRSRLIELTTDPSNTVEIILSGLLQAKPTTL